MVEKKSTDKPKGGAKEATDGARDAADRARQKKKKEKVSIDPAQRGFGGFDRSQLKGKAPIFRTMKKSGR